MKSITLPSGRIIKFGRNIPIGAPKFWLGDYVHKMHASSLTPPANTDYSVKASDELHTILGNDYLGDCFVAALYHYLAMATANADPNGVGFVPTLTQVIADYSAISGYIPGHPETDVGCDEQTGFNYFLKKGFANGTKVLGVIGIDAANWQECMLAMWLFESLIICQCLPDDWISPFPSEDNFTWDIAGSPDPYNGHAFMATGYNDRGLPIDTWGMLGMLTKAANAKYSVSKNGGGLYVLLTDAILLKAQQKAPNGIDWPSLVADFDSLGGNVPIPSPAPTPTPTPTPTPAPGVTLAQAEAWATGTLLSKHNWYMSPKQAATLVKQGLASNWPK